MQTLAQQDLHLQLTVYDMIKRMKILFLAINCLNN